MAQPLILGLGQTGLSLVAHFSRLGQRPLVADTRSAPPLAKELKRTHPDVELLRVEEIEPGRQTLSSVWASPGFPLHHPVLEQLRCQGLSIDNDIELFARELAAANKGARVLAVTGTNGKSTVCAMLGHALTQAGIRTQVAGNIGLPIAQLLARPLDAQVYVLELSSFQLTYVHSLAGHSGCILNLAEDHLDHHGSHNEYAAAKQRIYTTSEAQIVNADDPATWATGKDHSDNRYWFGLNNKPPHGRTERFAGCEQGQLYFGARKLLHKESLPDSTEHNLLNTLAAMALLASINRLDVAMHLASYSHLPHRCQALGEKLGRWFVNDSKATNPHAAIHSMQGMAKQYKKLVVIAGGDAKGIALDTLGAAIRRHCRALVVMGKDGAALARVCQGMPIHQATNMQQALNSALALSEPGDCITLCPGCASTDMYADYTYRGDAFMTLVANLNGEAG